MQHPGPVRLAILALLLAALMPLAVGCGGGGGVKKIGGARSEVVAIAGDTVTGLAFAPDGRLFISEQNSGDIRILTPDGQLLAEPFAHVEPARRLEWGLLGVAVDPDFNVNHYVYAYYTRPAPGDSAAPVLVRFTEADNRGNEPEVLIEFPDIEPGLNPVDVGGGLQFGPDGSLYVSIGDTDRPNLAQDLSSPFGKLLRVTRDGTPASDNPFAGRADADPMVYAYGFRNAFGFAIDPESGRIYAADNGPSNCDELNVVEAGEDYGWPRSLAGGEVPCQNPDAKEPVYLYAQPGKDPQANNSNVAPTGVAFLSAQTYPKLGDGLLVCEYLTKYIRRLKFDEQDQTKVTDDSVVAEDCSVALAADRRGVIYYSSGLEIHRLVPQ